MGTSNWQTMPFCISSLMEINPRRVLDVGVGFGRWGAVIREFCELWQERVMPQSWIIQIEGIEAFPDNIGPWQKSLYNTIHTVDAAPFLREQPGPWDVIIFGDVLEHFKKTDAMELLSHAMNKSAYVLVNIPIGVGFEQGERYGNPYEEHLSVWQVEDFLRPEARCSQLVLDSYNRTYLSVILSKEDPRNLGQKFGLKLDAPTVLNQMPPSAPALSPRTEQATKDLAAARKRTEQYVRWLEGNIRQIESSVAWRILKVANKLGLLWLPRQFVALARRFRGRSVPPAVAAPTQSAPAMQSTAITTPAPRLEFCTPFPNTSESYLNLLKLRPESFAKVYAAPALMSPQERVTLYGLTFGFAPERYLEIGTCRGGSAVVVSAALDDLGKGKAFGIDPKWAVSDETANLIKNRFTFVEGPSPQVLPIVAEMAGGKFDMILIDGDHSFKSALADLEGSLPLASPGGIILLHDAYWPEVMKAINQFMKAHPENISDCGMVATSCNHFVGPTRTECWGGIYMLRVLPAASQGVRHG